MRDIDDLTPEQALAESLVDEALLTLDIPADLRPFVRVTMIGELLTTPEGRAKLRGLLPDPKVGRSGDVAKPGAKGNPAEAPKRKAASKRNKPS